MLLFLPYMAHFSHCLSKRWLRLAHYTLAGTGLLLVLGFTPAVQAQDAKEPTKLILNIVSKEGANPDESGRPAPVKVRIYELKDSASFADADYFSLDKSDKLVLAADLLAKDEFILRPTESKVIERKSNPQTTAIGILAGYRDLPNSLWRFVFKLKEAPDASWMRALMPLNRVELHIQLQPQGIVVVEKP